MKTILSHLYRGNNSRFWVTLVIVAFLMLTLLLDPVLDDLRDGGEIAQGYHKVLVLNALTSDFWSVFTPILAGIPFAAEYVEDIKSKFARFLLIRECFGGYLLGQMLACWLCGGLSVVLGAGVAYELTVLLLTPVEQVVTNYTPANICIGEHIVLLFLNGGLWALWGMTLGAIMESKYVAYASPFIVYYLLVILYERYFPDAWLLYPKNWLNPVIWPYGTGSAVLFLLELTFLCGLVFYVRGKRRLAQL